MSYATHSAESCYRVGCDASYTTHIRGKVMMEQAQVARASPARLGPVIQFGLLAGPFLSMVDGNVVNVAIPQIARSFGAPLADVQWSVSGYLLALASGLAASAYLARRFGTRPVYVASLAGFTLASIACAFAGSTAELVGARVVQGLLGAPLVPLAMSMLLGSSGARQRISPAAGIVLFLAPALGPSVGGLLISTFGWQSVFLVNVPFGILGIAGVLAMDAGVAPGRDSDARFDAPGLVLLSAALVLATYGASTGPRSGWWSESSLPFWLGGLILLAAYAVWAFTRRSPVVDLRVLTSRDPALAIVLSIIAGLVLFAVLFLMPVFIQDVQGQSPTAAGLLLLPQGVTMAAGTIVGDALTRRHIVRRGVITGMVVLAFTTAALTFVQAGTPGWQLALLLCGRGIALGLIIQPLLVATLGELPQKELADANTMFNIVERVAGSFGVALMATFFQAQVRAHMASAAGPQAAAVAGFHDTVWLLVALSAGGFLISLLLPRRLDSAGTGG
jgi:EmrB/QacA subfamily drug resistance transporter